MRMVSLGSGCSITGRPTGLSCHLEPLRVQSRDVVDRSRPWTIEGALGESPTLRKIARDFTNDTSLDPEMAALVERFAKGDKDAQKKLLGMVKKDAP